MSDGGKYDELQAAISLKDKEIARLRAIIAAAGLEVANLDKRSFAQTGEFKEEEEDEEEEDEDICEVT
jgi:hypothetical protein